MRCGRCSYATVTYHRIRKDVINAFSEEKFNRYKVGWLDL